MGESARAKTYTFGLVALLVSFVLVLGLTLAVSSTNLNPGLPIMLGGALSAGWAGYRLIFGSSVGYHWGQDVFLAFVCWSALSAAFALDAYLAQKSLATLIGASGFIIGLQCIVSSGRQWRVCAHTFVLLTTIYSVIAWVMAISEARATGTIPAVRGTFNNPDVFSILPMLAFCLSLGFVERAKKAVRAFTFVQAAVAVISILASGCRAAMLGAFAGALVFGLTLAANRKSRLKEIKPLLVIPFAVLLLAIPLSNFDLGVSGKLSHTWSSHDAGVESTRSEVFWRGPVAVLQNPFFGAGPGCFGLAFQTVREEGHDELYIDIAHNDHVEVAVELGLFGLALWGALLWCSISKPQGFVSQGRRPVAASAIVGCIASSICFGLFNFILSQRPTLWALVWVLGLALAFPSRRSRTEGRATRYIMSLTILSLSVWAIHFGYQAMQADQELLKAKVLRTGLKLDGACRMLDKAIHHQPKRVDLRMLRAEYANALGAYERDESQRQVRKTHLLAARDASPANVLVLLRLAELHMEAKEFAAAQEALATADSTAPFHHLIGRKRAALAIRRGDLPQAAVLLAADSSDSGLKSRRLQALLHAIEIKNPGKGVLLLKNWLDDPRAKPWAEKTLAGVIRQASKNRDWEVATSFASIKLNDPDEGLCAVTQIARFKRESGGTLAEWQTLNDAMLAHEPSRSRCYGVFLARWSEVGLAMQEVQLVKEKLTLLLKEDRRQLQARIGLGSALAAENRLVEAIKLTREGLQFHERSPELLLQMAALYESAGALDLAFNYYRDAAKLLPDNLAIQAKVQKLRKQI